MPRDLTTVETDPSRECHSQIVARPYALGDPAQIMPRQWILGSSLLRGSLSLLVAPGAAGKTAYTAGLALSLATGRALLGKPVYGGAKRVWLWNLEDSRDELDRLLAAGAILWDIDNAAIGNRLFVNSGLDGNSLIVANEGRDGFALNTRTLDELADAIRDREIDVVVIDPFVSSHRVSENDNGAIDAIAKAWARLAVEANCAVLIVHHSRKLSGQENTADAARGASALVNAARSVLTINRMTDDEADRFGIDGDERRRFFRVYDDKCNRAPPADKSDWYRLESQSLGNGPNGGDSLPVVTPWTPPEAFDGVSLDHLRRVQTLIAGGEWRQDAQCLNWAGNAVAEALDLDLSRKADKARAKSILKTWLNNGALAVEQKKDEKRNLRPFVIVGKWADDNSASPQKSVVGQGVAVGRETCLTTPPIYRGVGGVAGQHQSASPQILAHSESPDDPVPGWEGST